MLRRNFLDPRHIGIHAKVDDRTDGVLLRFARRAMATQFEIVLPLATPRAHELADQALDEIDRLEQQLTVYRDASEVSRLNALAADHPMSVETNLFELLDRCRHWHRMTCAFDVASGALVRLWNEGRKRGMVPSMEERRTALEQSGMNHVKLDGAEKTVQFLRRGLAINLGAVGKGYALDRVVRLLRHEGVSAGLVHGGQSSVFAFGAEPGVARGWQVGLAHPETPSERLGIFHLRDRGVGISAATYQFFEKEGRKMGHILDPRSAWPAEGVATAAVTAPTAAEADALSTAFFILGVEPAREICAARPDLGVVLQTRGRLEVLGQAQQEFDA